MAQPHQEVARAEWLHSIGAREGSAPAAGAGMAATSSASRSRRCVQHTVARKRHTKATGGF